MCNQFNFSATLAQIRRLAREIHKEVQTTSATANLPEIGNVFPDQDMPVLRPHESGALELASLRWGFPPAKDKAPPITNIRNLSSSWWKNVNGEYIREARYRCLVPFTSFAEPDHRTGQKPVPNAWFRVPDAEIACFAGVWRPWHGERLKQLGVADPETGKLPRRKRVEEDWELFAFLTTSPNEVVGPIHEKAMPVVLTEPAEWAEWLKGGEDSLRLQRPLANDKLEMGTQAT